MDDDTQRKDKIIQNYIVQLKLIKTLSESSRYSISGTDFDQYLFDQYFNEVKAVDENVPTTIWTVCNSVWHKRRRFICLFLLFLGLALFIANYRNVMATIFMTNIQNFIYPGMSLWRRITMPIIRIFPGLTEFYDESCLVSNPFFHIKDLDCTPCMDVAGVMDLTELEPGGIHQEPGVPYIFKSSATPIDLTMLNNLYLSHKQIYERDAFKVQSTNRNINNLRELFDDFLNKTHGINKNENDNKRQQQEESHNMWRCNRMNPLRLLRQIITHPKRLPLTGMSIERYIAIDTPAAPSYPFPDMECSNIFAIQLKGTRTIVLRPTGECQHQCRTISVRLPASYVLMYDWWYWKPISVPDHYHHESSSSITYIGAYC